MAKVKVQDNGKAPSGLSAGDQVVTGGGTYKITGVNSDGSYKSEKVSDETTKTYTGSYDAPGGGNGSTSNSGRSASQAASEWVSSGSSGGGGGGGGGSGRNTSGTIARAVNTLTGVTEGYTPTGNWNDAGLRSAGGGAVDPITQQKVIYETGKAQYKDAEARGDAAAMEAAKKIMDDAHNAAEAYRAQFGYSGGDDGSENIPIPGFAPLMEQPQQAQMEVPEWEMPAEYSFTPFDQTSAGRRAMAEYQELLDKLQSYKPFTYNPEEDPLYQQYADSYTRSGQRAMSDILGQLAARTGGMASSYAGAMAQQQYDQYMAELAAKVPELRNLAYNMYADDYNRALGLYDRGYQRFADDFNRYMDQERFGYGMYNDRTRLGYDVYRDQVADQQWQQEFDWRKAVDERDYARSVLTGDRAYNRDVLTGDRAFEADRADTRWNQDWTQTTFDYQKEQDAWNRQLTERQMAEAQRSELYSRVAQGYVPTQEDAARYGLTASELEALQRQANNLWGSKSDKWWVY